MKPLQNLVDIEKGKDANGEDAENRSSASAPPPPSDSNITETTPLVEKVQPPEAEKTTTAQFSDMFAVPNFTNLKENPSIKSLTAKALRAKSNMKKSPWIISTIIAISCLGVIAAGIFGFFTYLVQLRLIRVVLKIYQILFGLICLVVEASRYFNYFNIRAILHVWLPLLELNVGRGGLCILTAGLALGSQFSIGEGVPAICLGLCGIAHLIWGIRASIKLKKLFNQLKSEALDKSSSTEEQKNGSSGILSIQKKFAALDLNGDGRLSKEELAIGCKTFNLTLEEGELDSIFSLLDPQEKGYIGIDDFEVWWYSEKDIFSYLK